MELKDYQQRVIQNIEQYLETLERIPDLAKAFKDYWDNKGAIGMDAYKNTVQGVPHVCTKVPTAGGKTFIAVNALAPIFSSLTKYNPKRGKLVVWLVPSTTILDQTVKALSSPEHPYRKRLDQLFGNNRVAVYEKKDLLMGAGFSRDSATEQLSIVVMSFDSFRTRNKDGRKIYQENSYLASFITNRDEQDYVLPDTDSSALINVIRQLRPVVVVDESHNAESELSVDMLQNLNADFILDLTATPRKNSNIISYVDALALKKQHMVKLPVIVANRNHKEEVIESALILRRQLEALAKKEEAEGGKYIRPIVLFQAQPRTNDDNTTFKKIKEKLIELKIPAEQIAIKTADINEIKNENLLSRDCPIRYIITVNALKEGWDCPFAYVLASLADKSSSVDVEQILGRILRMPHVQQHSNDLLNLSYVFTASSRFQETLDNIVKGLNRAGFSELDYRIMESVVSTENKQGTLPAINNDLFTSATETNDDEFNLDMISPDWQQDPIKPTINTGEPQQTPASFIEQVTQQAITQNQAFEKQALVSSGEFSPELETKMNRHKVKDIFKNDIASLKIPQFFIKVDASGFFDDGETLQLFEKEELLKDFKLSRCDTQISFDNIDSEFYSVDLDQIGENDYTPKAFKLKERDKAKFSEYILSLPKDSQRKNLASRLSTLIGNMYPITDQEIKIYISHIIETMEAEQIRDCIENDFSYVKKIKQKINTLADTHALKEFENYIDIDRILSKPHFSLPESITPSSNASSIPKSLYINEASMNNFERRMIADIANLDNIHWWHRNFSVGKGFRVNGYLNMYPDFIIKTTSGKIILLETKGDDRDNSDSQLKLKLGDIWESAAGRQFRYLMVFENNPVAGAEKLSDALRKIAQL